MRLPNNYSSTVPFTGEFRRLTPGGHMCVIQDASVEQARSGREMLVVRYDIAGEPDFEGIFTETHNRALKYNPDAKWPGVYRVTIEDRMRNCTGFFKGFIRAVEESNVGYNFEAAGADERSLSGKLFGLVFREEEYLAPDGNVRVSVKPAWAVPCPRLIEGVETPPRKTLEKDRPRAAFDTAADAGYDDELPF